MSDLRNNSFDESAPVVMSEEIRRENGFGEQHVLNDNGGLSGFHHFEEEEEGSNKAKMFGGALVVALLLGAAGIYAYTGTGSGAAPNQMAASKAPTTVASNTPAPVQTAPIAPPAVAPAAQTDTASNAPAKSPYDSAPAAGTTSKTASTDTDSVKPVKTARAHASKGDDAAQNSAESEQTAQLNKDNAADRATKNGSVAVPLSQAPSSDVAVATPAAPSSDATPLPTPPAPPASSVASNGQPIVAPQSGTTAQDIPAAPAVTPEQAAPATPAQAAPVTPAPQADQAAQPQAQPQ